MARGARVRATTSFVCEMKGEQVIVHAGDVLPANHPAVKAHPELFAPQPGLEEATPAGEVR